MAPPNNPLNFDLIKKESLFDLSEGKFNVKGVPLFHDVPKNVSFSSFSSVCKPSESNAPPSVLQSVVSLSHKGGFFGFSHETPSDRLMNSLGSFNGKNFLSVFRFKTWWSSQWVGNSGSDLQMETQWILIEIPEIKSYAVIIPIIEKSFRSALHPGSDGHFMICAESGSTKVKASSFNAIAYVHLSENPYNLMKEAYSAIRVHLNTFRLLEEKELPNIVDKFGWCTWDAFYLSVDPIGIYHGLDDFSKAGIAPRFVIIDDGWQSISLDGCDPKENAKNLILGGEQMSGRLNRLNEGDKFKKYESGVLLNPNSPPFNAKRIKELISKGNQHKVLRKQRDEAMLSKSCDLALIDSNIKKLKEEIDELFGGEESPKSECGNLNGMKGLTSDLRRKFKGLDDIYVWHALVGAWGGVRPETTHLKSSIVPCKLSPGLDGTMHDLAVVNIVKASIGLVHPDQVTDFYDSMHSNLAHSGITGVKVDVINSLEYVCDEYGGRVDLAKAYYEGLTKSIVKNFNGNGIMASMQQCNDFFFLGTNQISMGRAGDDFWVNGPEGDPTGEYWLQGLHMIHCSYNGLWMGQIIQPDWDMFQSNHVCGKFHAGSRAICGGPVYLSDHVGFHDFDLIKKLVFPDGTIPKCIQFPLPTRDCLFKNPLFDHTTVLKIWNFNKNGGVIGAFNCQGAGWDTKLHKFRGFPECYKPITGSVHVTEVEWDQNKEATNLGIAEEYVVYSNQGEKLCLMTQKSEPIKFIIQPSTFEIYNFVPITKLGGNIKFASIGLTNMFNSGGTILDIEYVERCAKIRVKGGGNFLAYSSESPKKFQLNGSEVAFEWLSDGKLFINVPWVEEAGGVSDLTIFF